MSQHLGHLVKADGRWRIFLFGGAQDPTEISSSAYQFVDFLANDASSPVLKYTPKGADVDSAIDTYAVFQQQGLSMHNLHDYIWPAKGKYGLRDYEKAFHAQIGNDLYDLRGINREDGCVLIVRPDQHIASILPVTAHEEVFSFFDTFMIEQG
jgi:phenol 2-monooxygenase